MRLEDIKTIGIVGAGQMGRGISQVCATAGYQVLLVDVAEPPLTEALVKIRASLKRAVEQESLTDHQAGAVLALIRPKVQLDQLRDVQLVIEAIPEDLAMKQELLTELNRVCQPQTVLASNTSSMSITKLGAASGRPDRVVDLQLHESGPRDATRRSRVRPRNIRANIASGHRSGETAGESPCGGQRRAGVHREPCPDSDDQ